MKKALLLLLILATLISCNNQKKASELPVIDQAFTSYIAAFTSGVISVNSGIIIRFVSDIPVGDREAILEEEVLECKPALKGSYLWTDNRTLEFRPDEIMPTGTVFQCSFHLGELLEVPSDLKTMKFQFQTMQQSISVDFGGLNSLDDEDLKWQQLNGALQTADYAPVEVVETMLSKPPCTALPSTVFNEQITRKKYWSGGMVNVYIAKTREKNGSRFRHLVISS